MSDAAPAESERAWSLPGLDALVDHGRARWIAATRRTLARLGARLPVEALPDHAMFDPRLHAYTYWPAAPHAIEQVLVGLLPAEVRPKALSVVADAAGVVHLPGLGWATGLGPRGRSTLRCSGREVVIDGATLHAAVRLEGGAELAMCSDPSWLRVLLHGRRAHDVAIAANAARHRRALERALAWLHALDPAYAIELARDLRMVVPFRSGRVGSCTNACALGAVFLQCEPDATAVFFCEDLAHQVGHLTFYAVTSDARRCFRVPPRVLVCQVGGPAHDRRSLYDALHGNFTICRMVQVLGGLLARTTLTPLERAEATGRLALALDRLGRGLDSVDDVRLFTAEIWALHQAMREIEGAMRQHHGAALGGLDLAEQPYVFDWATYRRRNGLDDRTTARGGQPTGRRAAMTTRAS